MEEKERYNKLGRIVGIADAELGGNEAMDNIRAKAVSIPKKCENLWKQIPKESPYAKEMETLSDEIRIAEMKEPIKVEYRADYWKGYFNARRELQPWWLELRVLMKTTGHGYREIINGTRAAMIEQGRSSLKTIHEAAEKLGVDWRDLIVAPKPKEEEEKWQGWKY